MPKKNLEFSTQNCWETFDAPEHRQAMDDLAADYLQFLSTCKTEREVVDYVREKALAAGFSEDFNKDMVFRVFRGKSIFIARRGKAPLSKGMRLLGAHGDSPRLDFKQRPLYEECGVGQAKTHYYGGIRKHQWLSRPLALHGVVVKKNGETVTIRLGEEPTEPVYTVLDLLPHLAQDQAQKKLAKAFDPEKMNIVLGHEPTQASKKGKKDAPKKPIKNRVLQLLNDKYGITEEDLYSAEIQAVPAGPARAVGLDGSLLGGYGQDDRVCAYTGLQALLQAESPKHAHALILWDKEEIGSDGSTGAKSMFMEYCLDDLIRHWEPKALRSELLLNTKAISADVHGALDPDYQEVHEKMNSATIGHGPCFCKFTGHRGKYGANDAHAEYVGWLRNLMHKAGVPWQMAELGKVDLGGGGTVAKYLAVYGMDIIDFGPPVLAMHSPFEITSKADVYATQLAYKAFMES